MEKNSKITNNAIIEKNDTQGRVMNGKMEVMKGKARLKTIRHESNTFPLV